MECFDRGEWSKILEWSKTTIKKIADKQRGTSDFKSRKKDKWIKQH